jgi:four helix bundle protein
VLALRYERAMPNIERLQVFHRAHSLTLELYRITGTFPAREKYELARQMRLAASSIGMNLAEGSARSSEPDYARFVSIAQGSTAELEYQLRLALDLGLIDHPTHDELDMQVKQVAKMLRGLRKRLKSAAPGASLIDASNPPQ